MKKTLFAILLCGSIVLGLTGCTKSKNFDFAYAQKDALDLYDKQLQKYNDEREKCLKEDKGYRACELLLKEAKIEPNSYVTEYFKSRYQDKYNITGKINDIYVFGSATSNPSIRIELDNNMYIKIYKNEELYKKYDENSLEKYVGNEISYVCSFEEVYISKVKNETIVKFDFSSCK